MSTYAKNYAEIDWSNTPEWRPRERDRTSLAPAVISDTMQAAVHMANGRTSESKSEFRRWTREAGCIEMGNDKLPPRKVHRMPAAGPDIKRAIEQLRAGYRG